jgi:hypothetical protein
MWRPRPSHRVWPRHGSTRRRDDRRAASAYEVLLVVKVTPAQLALVTDALHAYAENRVIDLNEIDDKHHRDIIRYALSIRRLALQDLIQVFDKVVLEEMEGNRD